MVIVSINREEILADARGPNDDPDASIQHLEVSLADHPHLTPGKDNIVEVRAFNAEGYLSSRGVRVVYRSPAQGMDHTSTLWVIVGGVSGYYGDQIDLGFSAKDAQDFAVALKLGAVELFGADRGRFIDHSRFANGPHS